MSTRRFYVTRFNHTPIHLAGAFMYATMRIPLGSVRESDLPCLTYGSNPLWRSGLARNRVRNSCVSGSTSLQSCAASMTRCIGMAQSTHSELRLVSQFVQVPGPGPGERFFPYSEMRLRTNVCHQALILFGISQKKPKKRRILV